MAGLQTSISLYDGVSGPLNAMRQAMDAVIGRFETMEATIGRAVDITLLQRGREELVKIRSAYDLVSAGILAATVRQEALNSALYSGAGAAAAFAGSLEAALETAVRLTSVSGLSDYGGGAEGAVSAAVSGGFGLAYGVGSGKRATYSAAQFPNGYREVYRDHGAAATPPSLATGDGILGMYAAIAARSNSVAPWTGIVPDLETVREHIVDIIYNIQEPGTAAPTLERISGKLGGASDALSAVGYSRLVGAIFAGNAARKLEALESTSDEMPGTWALTSAGAYWDPSRYDAAIRADFGGYGAAGYMPERTVSRDGTSWVSEPDFTGKSAARDGVFYTAAELELMKSMAGREPVNRYAPAEIRLEQYNTNYIDSDTDIDGLMDAWAADFARKLEVSGEGVY